VAEVLSWRRFEGIRRPVTEASSADNPLVQSSGRLIVICGLPGSGKTTLAKALEGKFRAIRFSPDDWLDALSINLHREDVRERVEALQWKLAQQLLAQGLTVIIEWGTWARSERDTLRLGARALGAAVELHYLSAPVGVLFARLQHRRRENPPIERDALSRWVEVFQVPTVEEMMLFDEPLVDLQHPE
jgi:predicted kinase